MRKLTRYLKNYKLNLILGPAFKLLEAIFELIVPLVMADIIDNGIRGESASVGYILGRGAIMVALGLAGLGFSLTCQYFASRCSQGFGTELRNDLFSHINTLSYAEMDRLGTPSMITRMTSDIDQLQVAVAMLIRLVIRAPFLVIGASIMAMTINLKLSLVFLAAAPLIALSLYFIMSKTIPMYGDIQRKLDRVSKITRENLSGVRVVRAFSKQDAERKRFDASADDLAKNAVMAGKISALLNPLTFVIINLAIVAILYFGGNLVDTGELTQGEVVAFINYLTQISLALVVVANLVIIYTKSAASAKRVTEVFDMSPSVQDTAQGEVTPIEGAPKILFDHVGFRYDKGGEVLRDLTLEIPAGQTVGIIGGTGSGKSSLINLIPRFYDITEGSLKIDGVEVKDYPIAQLRAKMGIVPQNALLFSGTIRSNLQWAKKDADDEQLYDALACAQAKDFVERKTDGLDCVVEQRGKNFSGGQRQRLTIARALVGNPEILILDDSTSALDFATDLALRRALAARTPRPTTLIVSQRATSLRYADQIVVLDHGNVAGIGKHEDLLQNCDVYREICQSQQKSEEVNA